ncbi:MAG: hypothetical protein QOI31_2834 [Solirubrobacterales bacterium]|jgi:hypothetical protein|nr:hypothetical protein [Solirubrobacterales bacterium]
MHFDLKRKTALVAATAALAIAGCGGDDDDGGSGEPLSAEDYATEIEDVLVSFGEASVALGTELSSAESPEELRSGVDELQSLTQTAVDDLNAITPPEDAAEGHETLTGALEGYLSDIESLAEAVESDDPEAAQEAALQFQEAAVDVQSQLAEAATQLEEAGIEPPTD